MDKFLLAVNPMRPEASGLWIIHMIGSKAIIKCSEGHIKPGEEIYQHFQFRNREDKIEEWTLSIYHLSTTDIVKSYSEQAVPILERAWRWFRSYLESDNYRRNKL